MTLTQLEYFLALAEHQSFSQAAKACGVTQPTLSAQFQKLEEELGHTLIDRKSQPVVLTPLGKAMFQQAAQTIKSAEGIKLLVDQFVQPLKGSLRLGILAPLGEIYGGEWYQAIHSALPAVEIQIVEGHHKELYALLMQAQLDAILTQGNDWKGQGLTEPLFEEAWWALSPKVQDAVPPAWSEKDKWLFGPVEGASSQFALNRGWSEEESVEYSSGSLSGRIQFGPLLNKWVLLTESEWMRLNPELQKRAFRLNVEPRTLIWVQGVHSSNKAIQDRVRDELKKCESRGLRLL